MKYIECLIIVAFIATLTLLPGHKKPASPVQRVASQIQQSDKKEPVVQKATVEETVTPAPVAVAPQPIVTLTDHEQIMADAGIDQADWSSVDYIISHESGWCATKWEGQYGDCPTTYTEEYSTESTSRGYGLCQSTPAIKMADAGSDWRTNPVTQLRWCSSHADQYGGWQGAAAHWEHQIYAIGHGNW